MGRKIGPHIIAACLAVGLMFVPASARAAEWYFNPGNKLGYTEGEGGGFTFGLEISTTPFEDRESFGFGPVVNIDYRWGSDIRCALELGQLPDARRP
ncbi:MAG: hypothetical protein ACOX6T_04185 [Myxococcales bacterium]|jgi:hypothetical protein